jgi:hypothetical protein
VIERYVYKGKSRVKELECEIDRGDKREIDREERERERYIG